MGTSRAIRYTVHFVTDRASWTPAEWRVRARGQVPGYGAPNAENLRKHCQATEASTKKGGVNAHLGETKILRAWIIDQMTGTRVAAYGDI